MSRSRAATRAPARIPPACNGHAAHRPQRIRSRHLGNRGLMAWRPHKGELWRSEGPEKAASRLYGYDVAIIDLHLSTAIAPDGIPSKPASLQCSGLQDRECTARSTPMNQPRLTKPIDANPAPAKRALEVSFRLQKDGGIPPETTRYDAYRVCIHVDCVGSLGTNQPNSILRRAASLFYRLAQMGSYLSARRRIYLYQYQISDSRGTKFIQAPWHCE